MILTELDGFFGLLTIVYLGRQLDDGVTCWLWIIGIPLNGPNSGVYLPSTPIRVAPTRLQFHFRYNSSNLRISRSSHCDVVTVYGWRGYDEHNQSGFASIGQRITHLFTFDLDEFLPCYAAPAHASDQKCTSQSAGEFH